MKTVSVPATGSNDFVQTIRNEFTKLELTSAKVLSLLGAVLVPGSIVLDYFINPEFLKIFAVIRLAIATFCLSFYLLCRHPAFQNRGNILSIASLITVGSGLLLLIHQLGYAKPYYAGLNLVYLATMITPWGFRTTISVCTCIFAGYLLPVLFTQFPPADINAFINNTTFQIETIIIASVINHYQRRRRYSETANRLTVERQSRELQEQDRIKQEFVANISHDLKTPLFIISGHNDILRDSFSDGAEECRYLDYIENSVFRINNLLDMLITTVLIENENRKPNLKLYNYPLFVKEFCDHFMVQAQQHDIEFVIDIPARPVVVSIDHIWIERILGNLIHNSFKFTPPGRTIAIRCNLKSGYIYTEIADTGFGIPADKVDSIFKRNVQAHDDKKDLGYGLGLAITKEMVALLGGEIEVQSEEFVGTTFRYSLPIHSDQLAQVKNAPTDDTSIRCRPSAKGST